MDYMFDNPRWSWRLQKKQEPYAKHDTSCEIARITDTGAETLMIVQLVPPPELFPFLYSLNHKDGDFESSFRIDIKGKRAVPTLSVHYWDAVEVADYLLFYWTPSTSPAWLRQYFG